MFAAPFTYHRATSVDDARRLLAAHPGAKLLAGGHSLLPMLKLRLAAPGALIDLGRVAELRASRAASDGVSIGAMTTHAEVASSPMVRSMCPALADAAGQIGDPAVRNRGTIGGSVAHADPSADLPTVLVAIGARFEIAGRTGRRQVPANEFFQGLMTTALAEGDVLTSVWVPKLPDGRGAAYEKFAHPASRYAVLGAAAVVDVADGKCTAARVVVGGLTEVPTRLPAVEGALVGSAITDESARTAAAHASDSLPDDLMGDIFASAEFRRGVAPVYVARAIIAAASRAK